MFGSFEMVLEDIKNNQPVRFDLFHSSASEMTGSKSQDVCWYVIGHVLKQESNVATEAAQTESHMIQDSTTVRTRSGNCLYVKLKGENVIKGVSKEY